MDETLTFRVCTLFKRLILPQPAPIVPPNPKKTLTRNPKPHLSVLELFGAFLCVFEVRRGEGSLGDQERASRSRSLGTFPAHLRYKADTLAIHYLDLDLGYFLPFLSFREAILRFVCIFGVALQIWNH